MASSRTSTFRPRLQPWRATALAATVTLLLAGCADPTADDDGEAAPEVEDEGEDTEGADTEAPEASDNGGAVEDHGTVRMALSVPESLPNMAADLGPSLGEFDECGVTVENIAGESSTVDRSLAAGEVDVTLQFTGRAIGGIMQGIPAKIVGAQSHGWGQVLVVSDELADAGIKSLDDLRAYNEQISFGVSSVGSAGDLSTRSLAETLDWTEGDDYEVVALGGVNEITAGLEAGVIDAFAWSDEVAYAAEVAGRGTVIEDVVAEAVGPTLFQSIVASDAIIEERPEALKAYLECYYDFVEELKGDPDLVKQLAVEEWDKDPEAVEAAMPGIMETWSTDGAASDEELEAAAENAAFQNEEVDDPPAPDEWWLYWGDL